MNQSVNNKENEIRQGTARKPTTEGNRFSIKSFVVAFFCVAAVLAWLSWSTYDFYTQDALMKGQFWRAEELRGDIIHLDEVLTMSARMAAATGDAQWEVRYHRFEPQLDQALKEILKLAPSQTLAQTDAANMRLVEMETQAFALVRQNHTEEARSILFSENYETQKRIYALGMTSIFEQLQVQLAATQRSERKRAALSVGAGIFVLTILLFSWLVMIRRMYKAHAVLLINVTKRKQTEEVLRKAQRELEVRVEGRTSELTLANTSLTQQISERARAEAALRESEESYRDLFENAQDAIYVHDLNGKYISANRAAEELYGCTRDEIVGKNINEFMAPEYVESMRANLDKKLDGKGLTTYEIEVRAKDGRSVPVEVSTRMIYEKGTAVAVQGMARDITERRRAEQRLAAELTVARVLAKSINVGEAAPQFLRAVCENLSWDVGVFWRLDPATGLLRCEEFWHSPTFNVMEFELLTRQISFSPGEGLPGRAWEGGEPLWMSDVAADSNFLRIAAAVQVGLHGAIGFPIRPGREVLGVMEFFSREIRKPDRSLLKMVAMVGNQIGQFIERKRAEEELRESEEKYRELIENANDIIYTLDVSGGFTSLNRAGERITGYTSEEALRMNIADVIRPVDVERVRERIAQNLVGAGVPDFELEILAKDGGSVTLDVSSRLAIQDGVVVGIQGIGRDINDRKRAEAELKENELQLVEAQHIALLGSWTWDIGTNMTSWSEALYHIYGIRPEDCPATFEGYLSVVHPDDRENISGLVERAVRTGQGCSYGHRIIRPDKSIRFHHVNLKVALDEQGQPIKLFGTAQDVTDRVQLELELKEARDAALESARLKSEFLANMSHEIRTPMNGVIGMTGLLLATELTSPQQEYTETIQSSAEALLTIIDDILDFSKIEAGLLRFEKIDFELRGAVEAPVELLAERARAKGLELASLVYRDVPTELRGDPGRLRQVLTNLIGNAVKFTDHGEVVVVVRKVSETRSHVMLRFEIRDTGIGISTEAQRGLFRAFIQADGSTTRKYGGTGLGLAISKQLVELMGGEIGIESAPRHGSTFWFTGRFEKQLTPGPTQSEPAGDLSGATVLIVDDNATNRNILKHQTSSWGMVATEAESGKRALELLRAGANRGKPYDIAVLDLMMPEMDGFQLAEAIKSDPTIAAVVLILLPSFTKRGHGERARKAGIAAYLQKPVRQSQLYNCLTAVMAGSESEHVTESRLVTRHSLRESKAPPNGKTLSNVRILVAEDNLVNQKVALGQLYNLGYYADAVPNGRELLKALESDHVDIILMDCQMPEMDGFAATEEIRRREGTGRHTTIIAMTANALDGDRERCLAAGMDDYIRKPVKSEVLRLKLERWTKAGESGKGLSEGNEAAQPTRSSVIDQAQLASLREIQQPGEPDFVTELIDLFLNETGSHLKTMRAAVVNKDAVEVRRMAHLLKGSSANIGARRMAALYEEIEGQDRDNGEGAALFARIEKEFGVVSEALKAERRGIHE